MAEEDKASVVTAETIYLDVDDDIITLDFYYGDYSIPYTVDG